MSSRNSILCYQDATPTKIFGHVISAAQQQWKIANQHFWGEAVWARHKLSWFELEHDIIAKIYEKLTYIFIVYIIAQSLK